MIVRRREAGDGEAGSSEASVTVGFGRKGLRVVGGAGPTGVVAV